MRLEGRVFKWLRSYLSGRTQRISAHGCQPEEFQLKCGVSQGSCLEMIHLPFSITNIASVNRFKKVIKTFLFAKDSAARVAILSEPV